MKIVYIKPVRKHFRCLLCGLCSVGPLRSMVEDLQSEESDDDDSSSDEETPVKNNLPNRDSRSLRSLSFLPVFV